MKKIFTVLIIIVISLFMLNIQVLANSTANVTLETSKDKVKKGETFTVIISVSSEDGINGITGEYTYDMKNLELVNAGLIDATQWANLGVDNQITVLCNSTSKITDSDVYMITFKVKDTATIGAIANISVNNILIDTDAETNSQQTIESISTQVEVIGDSTPSGDQNTDEDNSGEEENGDGNEHGNENENGNGSEESDSNENGNNGDNNNGDNGSGGNNNNSNNNGNGSNGSDNNVNSSNGENGNNGNGSINSVVIENNNSYTSSPDVLPQTGESHIFKIVIFVMITFLVMLTVIFYKKYKEYKNI